MEDIRGRAIVHNDHLVQVSPQLVQVLHVVAAMKHAGLAKQTCPKHTPPVQEVGYRICVFSKTSGEQYTLIQFSHSLKKVVNVRSLQNIHLVNGSVDFYWHNKVCIVNWFERAMH
uniref:Uncharacterized protein n=1 Tax=Cacopsylla melanoneura TaxID=428564 RepID=A0A8D8R138_9HEMI